MSRTSELDIIIADYVGYTETEETDADGKAFLTFDCADPRLYDCITKELSEHINGNRAEKDLSKEAKACWKEFVEYMKNYSSINKEI